VIGILKVQRKCQALQDTEVNTTAGSNRWDKQQGNRDTVTDEHERAMRLQNQELPLDDSSEKYGRSSHYKRMWFFSHKKPWLMTHVK
jgi:hypothetical protein